MTDNSRGERLQIMLTQDELEALDNWRFTRRMPSRAAAVRELLKRGLADASASPGGRGRSQDFGVIDAIDDDDPPARRSPEGNGSGRRDSPDEG
ncbi:MAG TPA: hypothetical protein VF122_04670 [Caulobacteraceae bacterium]